MLPIWWRIRITHLARRSIRYPGVVGSGPERGSHNVRRSVEPVMVEVVGAVGTEAGRNGLTEHNFTCKQQTQSQNCMEGHWGYKSIYCRQSERHKCKSVWKAISVITCVFKPFQLKANLIIIQMSTLVHGRWLVPVLYGRLFMSTCRRL